MKSGLPPSGPIGQACLDHAAAATLAAGSLPKTGQLWAYARDDQPWGGSDPPGVAYVYAPDRTAVRPIAHLAGFTGVLQVDGYAAYEVLAKGGAIRLAYCWSHVRRAFYELAAASPIATEALYRIEAEIRGRPAGERRAARHERSRPLIDALEPWLPGEARADQSQEQARRGDPLRADPLGRPEPVPRRRACRDRLQHGRAHDPATGPEPQEHPVRRLGRRRRRALGGDRLADRDVQARRRRAARLPRRRHHPHRRRPPPAPPRPVAAMGLPDHASPQSRGLKTALTVNQPARRLQQLAAFALVVAPVAASQLDEVGGERSLVVSPPRHLALRRAMLTECPASPAFGHVHRLHDVLDTRTSARVAQKFPRDASCRFSLSSVRSAIALRSRWFSTSRSFISRTWSDFSPPHSLRQR